MLFVFNKITFIINWTALIFKSGSARKAIKVLPEDSRTGKKIERKCYRSDYILVYCTITVTHI